MNGVSVVMCTYNGEQFIGTQLESILAQTEPPTEVIISDDGSADATLDIVRSIAQTAATPILIRQNECQLGFSDNFISACRLAQGSLIAFSDQDDTWAPQKLEIAQRALQEKSAELCVHAVRYIDPQGHSMRRRRLGAARARVIRPLQADPWGNFYGFTMLFDRSLLGRIPDDVRGPDPYTRNAPLSHDRWVYFLASTFGRIVILADSLADYRQHDLQMYGGAENRAFTERIRTKMAAGQSQACYLADVAAHRASLLEEFAPAGDDSLWREGAERWRTIESLLSNRARLHERMTGRDRLRLLAKIFRDGAYRTYRHGGLGPRRLAEDVMVSALRFVSIQ